MKKRLRTAAQSFLLQLNIYFSTILKKLKVQQNKTLRIVFDYKQKI